MQYVPLQLWGPDGSVGWMSVYIQATDVLMAVLGLFIAYHAYRGFRRNESRPMLYISIGFILVLAVPFILLVAASVITTFPDRVGALLIQTIQILGLAAILYGFRLPDRNLS